MATKHGKKISGGRYKKNRKKKLSEARGRRIQIILGEERKKKIKKGSKQKIMLLKSDKANVMDPKTHKSKITEIKNVLEVPSNIFLARKNIIVKGAVIETGLGKARITNRSNKESCINAVLIS